MDSLLSVVLWFVIVCTGAWIAVFAARVFVAWALWRNQLRMRDDYRRATGRELDRG